MTGAHQQSLAVRQYRPSDRTVVRDICYRTAYRNHGAEAVFDDPELFCDYWTRYYTDFNPDRALVAEIDGRPVGYLLGCTDHRHFVETMKRHVAPRIIGRFFARSMAGRYRTLKNFRFGSWVLLHSWREALDFPFNRYPVHFHCNFLKDAAGRHGWSVLVSRFLDDASASGATHIHGAITEPRRGPFTKMFQQADLHEAFAEGPSSFHRIMTVWKPPIYNRVWGWHINDFRQTVTLLAERYGL